MNSLQQKALADLIERGPFRPGDALSAGVPRSTIYSLWHQGELVRLAPGLFAGLHERPDANETLLRATKQVPKGIVCLLSALAFFGLTTQNPREVWLAIPEKARRPRALSAPIHFVRFSGRAYELGAEKHQIGSAEISVYGPAKTVADCFKYRNKIGLDVALEALRDCWRQRTASTDELIRYARICRVEKIMRPYLEALAA